MAEILYTSTTPSQWYNKGTGQPVKLSTLGLGKNAPSYTDSWGNYYIDGPGGQTYTTLKSGGRSNGGGLPDYDPNSFNYNETLVFGTPPSYGGYTSEDVPTYNQSYTKLPTYTAPTYDENAITTLAQQRAAPGLRALRNQVNRASGVNYENPNAKRMTLRDALQGYGQGVANVINAAGQQATSEYNAKYSRQSENAANEFQSQSASVASENQYAGDVAKTQYSGALTGWQAKEAAKAKKAEMDYQAQLEQYKAENDIAKTKFVTAYDLEKTKYSKYMDYYTKMMTD
jgi:hypothetical protein